MSCAHTATGSSHLSTPSISVFNVSYAYIDICHVHIILHYCPSHCISHTGKHIVTSHVICLYATGYSRLSTHRISVFNVSYAYIDICHVHIILRYCPSRCMHHTGKHIATSHVTSIYTQDICFTYINIYHVHASHRQTHCHITCHMLIRHRDTHVYLHTGYLFSTCHMHTLTSVTCI